MSPDLHDIAEQLAAMDDRRSGRQFSDPFDWLDEAQAILDRLPDLIRESSLAGESLRHRLGLGILPLADSVGVVLFDVQRGVHVHRWDASGGCTVTRVNPWHWWVRHNQEITCHEAVVDEYGDEQPCDATAVAIRLDYGDSTEGDPYPVCDRHARAVLVPLQRVLEILQGQS